MNCLSRFYCKFRYNKLVFIYSRPTMYFLLSRCLDVSNCWRCKAILWTLKQRLKDQFLQGWSDRLDESSRALLYSFALLISSISFCIMYFVVSNNIVELSVFYEHWIKHFLNQNGIHLLRYCKNCTFFHVKVCCLVFFPWTSFNIENPFYIDWAFTIVYNYAIFNR